MMERPEMVRFRTYWNGLRSHADEEIPSLSSIQLIDIPGDLIRNTCVVMVEHDPRRYYIRFAGESYYDALGFEPSRKYLDDLDLGPSLDYWLEVYDSLVETGAPQSGLLADGAQINAPDTRVHWMKLPLSGPGNTVSGILSYTVFEPMYQFT